MYKNILNLIHAKRNTNYLSDLAIFTYQVGKDKKDGEQEALRVKARSTATHSKMVIRVTASEKGNLANSTRTKVLLLGTYSLDCLPKCIIQGYPVQLCSELQTIGNNISTNSMQHCIAVKNKNEPLE